MPERLTYREFVELVNDADPTDLVAAEERITDVLRDAGHVHVGDDLAAALLRYQRYNDLEETGELDEATKAVLVRPRCALPDLREGAFTVGCRWPRPAVSFAFDQGSRDIPQAGEFDAVRRALRTMSRSGAPHFVESSPADPDVDVLIGWRPARCGDYDLTGPAAAHASLPPCSGEPVRSAVHFDDEELDWAIDGDNSSADVESVALHEAGHVVGLDHTNVAGAVMASSFALGTERRELQPDDLAGIMALYRGRMRSYRMGSDGKVARRIESRSWTAGWTTAEFFEVGGSPYLFLLKHGTGDVHVYQVERDGRIGRRQLRTRWTPGWTTVHFYELGGKTYAFLLKERGTSTAGKTAHINVMKADGTFGERVGSYEWTEGWTTAEFYEAGGKPYLLLLKERGLASGGHNVQINRVNADGTIGERIQAYRVTEGWTTVRLFRVGGSLHAFFLKAKGVGDDKANVHIHKVQADGTIAPSWYYEKWTEGWTSAEFFETNGRTYLLLLKLVGVGDDGNNVHIHRMKADGSVGPRVASHLWTTGWSTVRIRDTSTEPQLFLLKSCAEPAD